jgi:glycosyltransferase involved in cell wall biosynthesis
VAGALWLHRARGSFEREVDLFLAPSEFARRKLVAGGLPAERVRVKPNFVAPDPGPREAPGDYALYAGRLAPEKGLATLLAAWADLPPEIPLRLAGEGPLRAALEARAARLGARVRFLGQLPREDLVRALRGARLLVFPSEAFETFGLAIAEAFACGVPVLAAGHGSAAELVEEGRTGLHFRPGDARDLAGRIAWAWAHPEALVAMGRAARQEYESRYSAERNLSLLLDLYRAAGARAD